jgi:2-dehydropantoate 2-reductase
VAAAKVVILGAGSVGCLVGGAWQAAGIPVSFIGRKRLADDIEKHGLKITTNAGWEHHFEPREVRFSTAGAALAEADVIALCVKSADTAEAARSIAAHASPGTLVVSFQNGISNVDILKRELGDRFDVARGMVPFNCVYLGDGRFHKGVSGSPLVAEDRPVLREVSERVADGPAPLDLSDDMLAIAWGKLLINLNNATNALSGRTLLEQLRHRDYRRVFAATMREGLRVLDQAGIRPAKVGAVGPRMLPFVIDSPDWLFNSVFIRKWKIDAKARSSMSDDLRQGRKTEVDYINGELVALAERIGADAPLNRRIVELVRRAEAGAAPLGPEALRTAVLGR